MAARIALVSVLSLVGLVAAVAQQPAVPLLGFTPTASEAQRVLEADFRADLDAEDQAEWARRLSARPHHVGSPYGAANARYLAELFASWGYEVETETYQILMPFPDVRVVEMTAPEPFRATLEEDVVPDDASTAQRDEVLAPYNAFSADGEAEGELVFVNYGVPEDYEVLERYGIDVAGKIAIARYGRSWRGIKPKLAAEHGAIGALIYSDPIDDGYAQGDVYPDGPFKNASGVQRGSVMDMPVHTGDVLTPGRPAIPGTPRLGREEAPTITKIPVLPISYRDAQPLLAALGGEVVPPPWRGALPITYHFGPGPARVRLEVRADWRQVDAMNVIARWPGARYPDEWILRGNHHDAWNHGARDPVSGLVTLLSEAKAAAALARAGRPPQRTLVYAAWDAEEQGLIGSTEWVEHHAEELDRHAVAYVNTDGYGRGFLDMGGSHVLEAFFSEVAGDVQDPQTGVPLAGRLRATLRVNGDERQRSDAERATLRLDALGSGSDYTPFLQHLGIASANLSFGGESDNGSYHTLYDTYDHFTGFVDPGFRYGVTLSEVAGLATLRLANAPLLPVRFTGLADSLSLYLEEIETLANSARQAAERRAALLDRGDFALVLDPERALGPPPPLPKVPHFNFAPLKNAVEALAERAKRVDARLAGAGGGDASLEEINALLYRSERLLTSQEGLPGRPWYRHQVYAPGFYTGYGVKTLPRVREAIEARLYDEVDAEIVTTAATLEAFAEHLARIDAALDDRRALPLDNLGLEHLDIVVSDPAASARFYTRIFGSPLHQQAVRDTVRVSGSWARLRWERLTRPTSSGSRTTTASSSKCGRSPECRVSRKVSTPPAYRPVRSFLRGRHTRTRRIQTAVTSGRARRSTRSSTRPGR